MLVKHIGSFPSVIFGVGMALIASLYTLFLIKARENIKNREPCPFSMRKFSCQEDKDDVKS